MTLARAILLYLERLTAQGYATRTVDTYRPHLERFREWAATRNVGSASDVTTADLRAYAQDLMALESRYGRPLSLSTQSARLGVLKSLFAYLVQCGALLASPAQDLELPRQPPRSMPLDIPTARELDQILCVPNIKTQVGLRDRAVLELLYSTGLRNAELRALRVWDVDLAGGVLKVIRGKGKGDRVVPLGREACHWVERYLAEVRPHWVRSKRDAVLFLSTGGRPLDFSNLNKLVHACARHAGVTKRVTVHTFRHACATHMLRGGADIRHLQRLLGHRSLESTALYTHLELADLKRAHRRHHPRAGRAGRRVEQRPKKD